MSNCRTASATERRKSPSPAFCSNPISGSLSSVIGPPHWSEWKLRNSTLERWSDGHLALHPHGHQISTTSTDATADDQQPAEKDDHRRRRDDRVDDGQDTGHDQQHALDQVPERV